MIRLHATLLISALSLAALTQAQASGTDAGSSEGPVLEVAGSCPGGVSISVYGMTPAGHVVLAASLGRGTSVIRSGSCEGTLVDLASPRIVAILNADYLGEAGLATGMQGSSACGSITLQALDVATCLTTRPVRM